MDADFVIDLAARCQRVAILTELIRMRLARARALKGQFSIAAAGGGFKSPAPGAHNIPSEGNQVAGGRVGMVEGGAMERPWASAAEHNRFSRGRW